MKYTLIEAKGQYALILRGESMTQDAVVCGLNEKTRSWAGRVPITTSANSPT